MPEIININGVEIPVEQFRDNWALALMSQGVIVRLRLSKWSGSTHLTPNILGLKFIDEEMLEFVKSYISFGQHKLIPKSISNRLTCIEVMARHTLENYSFNTVWGHFILFRAFNDWQKCNEEVRLDYVEAAKQMGYQYDTLVSTIREDYSKLARDVWHRLHPNDPVPSVSFVEGFVNNIVAKIPSREDLVASFKYETIFLTIPMPSLIEMDIFKADQIKRDNEIKTLTNDLEKEVKKKVAEDYLKRKKEFIDGFLDKTVMELRRYVTELCDNVLKSLQQSNKMEEDLGRKNQDRLTKMISKVKLLNFYDDEEINKLMNDLELEINKFKGERKKSTIVEKLQEIVEVGSKQFVPKNFNPAMGWLKVETP